mmetsp:Transcript_40724/g.101139  ORF Transcript_40724/g.101139 Transcript_40724/m.101139 type:complete len:328 (+) Transcript_40724:1096-2079(+)
MGQPGGEEHDLTARRVDVHVTAVNHDHQLQHGRRELAEVLPDCRARRSVCVVVEVLRRLQAERALGVEVARRARVRALANLLPHALLRPAQLLLDHACRLHPRKRGEVGGGEVGGGTAHGALRLGHADGGAVSCCRRAVPPRSGDEHLLGRVGARRDARATAEPLQKACRPSAVRLVAADATLPGARWKAAFDASGEHPRVLQLTVVQPKVDRDTWRAVTQLHRGMAHLLLHKHPLGGRLGLQPRGLRKGCLGGRVAGIVEVLSERDVHLVGARRQQRIHVVVDDDHVRLARPFLRRGAPGIVTTDGRRSALRQVQAVQIVQQGVVD